MKIETTAEIRSEALVRALMLNSDKNACVYGLLQDATVIAGFLAGHEFDELFPNIAKTDQATPES